MSEVYVISCGPITGKLGKVLHRDIDCLKIRWSEIIKVSARAAKKKYGVIKKCKNCC